MRYLINLVERLQKPRKASDLKDFDGEALKPNCTKCIPDEITYADFCFVWWVGGSDDEMEEKREAIQKAEEEAKKEDVKHADMVTGQLSVNPEKVQALLDEPTDNLPIIHKWNGYLILFDGNHRVVADVLRGQLSTECWVADLDPYFDKKGWLKTSDTAAS